MRRMMVLVVAVALATAAGCVQRATTGGDQGTKPKGPVTIGSKIDTEGELLSEIIGQVLAAGGFDVVDKSQTGTTDVVRKALLNKEIDIYPEYTGSGYLFFKDQLTAQQLEEFKNPEKGYALVKSLDLEKNGVAWLTPARANNTWAIAAKKDFATGAGLATMSDLAAYVKAGKPTKIAASDEFFNNADANPAFEQTYGYKIAKNQRVTFSGGNTAQTEKAVADGTDGVNFGMAYGTDGALSELGLVVLADDKGAQLVYWPVPITRRDIVDKYPEIESLLKPAFDALTLEKLQELNARIQVNGESADVVAKDFLAAAGLVK